MNTKFSDFIRNASPEEKAEVYMGVMKKATERQKAMTDTAPSETPQTDALVSVHDEASEFIEVSAGYKDLLEHARSLERSLAQAQQYGIEQRERAEFALKYAAGDRGRLDFLAELLNVEAIEAMGGKSEKGDWARKCGDIIFRKYEFYRRTNDTPEAFRAAIDAAPQEGER